MNLFRKFLSAFGVQSKPKTQQPEIGIVKSDDAKRVEKLNVGLFSGFGGSFALSRNSRFPATRCELYGRHKGRNSRIHKTA